MKKYMPMKPFNDNEIAKRFWNGDSSLSEENHLLESSEGIEKSYKDFVLEKRKTPTDLENRIWKGIETKNKQRLRVFPFVGIAASIVALVGIFGFIKHQEHHRELEAQFVLIEQTLQHAANEVSVDENGDETVLYADELITIVAEN